ncbi:hypothetical protein B0J11DRAFT_613107 [Dendryphion nanum]|uniref:Uncharacterized protein n=1 Tax=Dendryphion nanum TaxID=256645 RepID=A0A9P9E4L1_9PLEO|nr:hypothetical protein B0J11DRAFT_613107 [Dendryphion nanum]
MKFTIVTALFHALLAFPLATNAAAIPDSSVDAVKATSEVYSGWPIVQNSTLIEERGVEPLNEPNGNVEKRAACTLWAKWDSNWVENAARRYRVRLVLDTDINLTVRFCHLWLDYGSFAPVSNPQCFFHPGLNTWAADVSFIQGPVGHGQYLDSIQRGLNKFREVWGCDVNSDI